MVRTGLLSAALKWAPNGAVGPFRKLYLFGSLFMAQNQADEKQAVRVGRCLMLSSHEEYRIGAPVL
jgi:hypothetical protein